MTPWAVAGHVLVLAVAVLLIAGPEVVERLRGRLRRDEAMRWHPAGAGREDDE